MGTIIIGCETDTNITNLPSNDEFIKNKSTTLRAQNRIVIDEESYNILYKYSQAMGYESITTSSEPYNINYSSSNYGTAKIPLKNYTTTSAKRIKITIRLAIYSRKKRCLHGVGLRCPLNSGINQIPRDISNREFDVTLEVNEDDNTLDIEFLEYVDWELLNNS